MIYAIRSLIALVLMLLSFSSMATTPEYITWVTRGKVTMSVAREIVRNVYAQAIVNDIPPELIFRVMQVESTFQPKAKSRVGATGLMQVMKRWHPEKIQGRSLYNIAVNIEVGARILREYMDNYGTTLRALQAYEGNRKSLKYYRKVMAVSFYRYHVPYPGSDDVGWSAQRERDDVAQMPPREQVLN